MTTIRPMSDVAGASAQLTAGLALHRAGDLAGAERCYLDAIAVDSTQAEALKLLSVLALESGDLTRATAYVDAALVQRPTAGEYWHLLGRIKLQQGELEAALGALSRAVSNGTPQRRDALLDLATCQARRKAWQGSLEAARAVLADFPDHADAQRIAGYACFHLSRDSEALAHFERFLTGVPSHAGAWHASSVLLLRSGNAGAAFDRAVKAGELAPDNVEYAYQRRLSAANAVPSWHFNMLHDAPRNAAFAEGIAARIKRDQLVLEIGTGAGLLALLAGRSLAELGGSGRVVTCEANPVLARTAVEIVAANGLSERVQVIAKPSTELSVGVDLPERADLLICEVFSVQVISEGVLPTLEDAKARLLKADALIIPASASARGALVASEALARKVRVGSEQGFELSALNAFAPVVQYLQPGLELTLLSDALDLLSFDLAGRSHFPAEKRSIEVPVTAAGVCQGVVQWLRLDLAPGVDFENRPDAAEPAASQHWAPVFYPFSEPVALEVGQHVTLRVSHNRSGMRVELVDVSACTLGG